MTPDAFRAALSSVRWSQRQLADILQVDERLVRRMAAGSADIPAWISEPLAKLAAFHDSHQFRPPPR